MFTAIVKTFNSEETLCTTLESLKKIPNLDIVICDENSTDDTVEIAKTYKSKICYFEKNDFPNTLFEIIQESENDWILILNDDEVLEERLAKKIIELTDNQKIKQTGFYIDVKSLFFNQELKAASKTELRLFKKEAFKGYDKNIKLKKRKIKKVHKKFGSIYKYSKNDIEKDILSFIEDSKYLAKKSKITAPSVFLKPFASFLYHYFIKLSFLDGRQGFIYSANFAIKKYIYETMLLERNYKKGNL